jgi:hypothetical protein
MAFDDLDRGKAVGDLLQAAEAGERATGGKAGTDDQPPGLPAGRESAKGETDAQLSARQSESGVPPLAGDAWDPAGEAHAAWNGLNALGVGTTIQGGKDSPRLGWDDDGKISLTIQREHFADAEQAARRVGVEPGRFSRLILGEELIHAAHVISLRNEWEAGGRQGGFEAFVANDSNAIFHEIRATVDKAGPVEKKLLLEAVRASYHAYNSSLQRGVTEKINLDTILNDIATKGNPMRFVGELLRQTAQIRREGSLSEEAHADLTHGMVQHLAAWVRDAIDKMKQALPGMADGRFGKRAQHRLARLEAIVDEAEKKLPEKTPNPAEDTGGDALMGRSSEGSSQAGMEDARGGEGKEHSPTSEGVDGASAAQFTNEEQTQEPPIVAKNSSPASVPAAEAELIEAGQDAGSGQNQTDVENGGEVPAADEKLGREASSSRERSHADGVSTAETEDKDSDDGELSFSLNSEDPIAHLVEYPQPNLNGLTENAEPVPVTEAAKAIDRLNADLEKRKKPPTWRARLVPEAEMHPVQQTDAAKLARMIAGIFKKRVVIFETEGKYAPVNGIAPNSKDLRGYTFLHNRAKRPHLLTIGHELWHHLTHSSPEFAGEVYDLLKSEIKDFDKVSAVKSNYPLDKRVDEMMADFLGDSLADQKFWKRLEKKNPEVFSKFAMIAYDWLSKIVLLLKVDGAGSYKHFKDVERAHDILAEAVSRFANSPEGVKGGFQMKGTKGGSSTHERQIGKTFSGWNPSTKAAP